MDYCLDRRGNLFIKVDEISLKVVGNDECPCNWIEESPTQREEAASADFFDSCELSRSNLRNKRKFDSHVAALHEN